MISRLCLLSLSTVSDECRQEAMYGRQGPTGVMRACQCTKPSGDLNQV